MPGGRELWFEEPFSYQKLTWCVVVVSLFVDRRVEEVTIAVKFELEVYSRCDRNLLYFCLLNQLR